jgi:hypothetical protein
MSDKRLNDIYFVLDHGYAYDLWGARPLLRLPPEVGIVLIPKELGCVVGIAGYMIGKLAEAISRQVRLDMGEGQKGLDRLREVGAIGLFKKGNGTGELVLANDLQGTLGKGVMRTPKGRPAGLGGVEIANRAMTDQEGIGFDMDYLVEVSLNSVEAGEGKRAVPSWKRLAIDVLALSGRKVIEADRLIRWDFVSLLDDRRIVPFGENGRAIVDNEYLIIMQS